MSPRLTHLATLRAEDGDWTVLHVRRPAFRGPPLLVYVLGSLRAPVRRHVVMVDARVYAVLGAGSMARVEQGLRAVLLQYENAKTGYRSNHMTGDPPMPHDAFGT